MGEQLVKISQDQQITDTDLNKIGTYARDSLDHVVADGIDSTKKYSGFQVVESGPAQITVGTGRFYQAGAVYARYDDGGVEIDLIGLLPAVVEKIVAIVAWGQEVDTAVEPRTFLVDVDTEQTEARAVATEIRRVANINTVSGVEAADPQPPAVDANVLPIAYVRLSPTGIESIEQISENRIESVASVSKRASDLELWRGRAGSRLDVLDTSVAGIQAALSLMPQRELVYEVIRDVARLKTLSELPETYTSYNADRFLTLDGSDDQHVDWLARVEEGVHFADAAVATAQFSLLNPIDPLVEQRDNFILPKFGEVEREHITGRDGEVSIAQYQYQNIQTVKKERTRTRIRYGVTKSVCTNSRWWRSGTYDPVTNTFRRGGETWEVDPDYIHLTGINHRRIRVTQYFVDTITETYWEAISVTEGVSASFMGETFLNGEPGYITGVGLYFTRVARTGDVTVMITETENGRPMFDAAIARVTVQADTLKTYPSITKVDLPPTYLEKGNRYAIVVASAGNHFLATVQGNKNNGGSLFYSTDGAWAQADLKTDLAYSLYYAQFESPRVEVQLQPLQLQNGIADIDLSFDSSMPGGTEISFEVQIGGEWKPLKQYDTNILNGLPPLLPLRVVLLGTVDVMPGIGVGPRSESRVSRPRSDYTHISTERTLPAPCDTVEVTVRLEYWDESRHTCDIKLMTGDGFSTTETPDTVIDEETPDPAAIIRRATFSLAAPINEYKIRIEGTTDNVLVTYHVAERYDLAFS